jgi:hypothetical protein
MSEQNKPFVVTDRRKFASDGTPRPDADPSPEPEPREVTPAAAAPTPISAVAPPANSAPPAPVESQLPDAPPPPTAGEMEQANSAYQQTADRLDTAVRAANPGMDHPPVMNFEQIVQSIYMTTIMQLGGGTPEGQPPKIDLMGARQSIDMLSILSEKTRGNLNTAESSLMDSALFELRMGFLEVTQALARSAQTRQPPPGAPSTQAPGRPSIVR